MPIYLNDQLVPAKQFAGGERNVNIETIGVTKTADITAYLPSSNDIFDLLLTVDALRRKNGNVTINLAIPYFPYARQDRVCNPGEALSVEVMAGLINGLKCNSVIVFDPHSSKTMELLENARPATAADVIAASSLKDAIKLAGLEILVPDKGAITRAEQVRDLLGLPIHYCEKERDPATGMITKTVIPEGVRGKKLIIIDDICDGGRTFIGLGEKLKEAGAAEVDLFVTHGIFMAGLEILKPAIDKVFCLHTYLKPDQRDPSLLTVLEEEMDAHPLSRFVARTSLPALNT